MSYTRFGPSSDVYVYSDVGGYVACCGCILGDKWDFHSVTEIVAHMAEHQAAGHKVPGDLLDPETFADETFRPTCPIFMCRAGDEGHDGHHSPVKAEYQAIRDRTSARSAE
jgi:hypothetical protein